MATSREKTSAAGTAADSAGAGAGPSRLPVPWRPAGPGAAACQWGPTNNLNDLGPGRSVPALHWALQLRRHRVRA